MTYLADFILLTFLRTLLQFRKRKGFSRYLSSRFAKSLVKVFAMFLLQNWAKSDTAKINLSKKLSLTIFLNQWNNIFNKYLFKNRCKNFKIQIFIYVSAFYKNFTKLFNRKKTILRQLSCTFICNLIRETTISFTIHFFRFSGFFGRHQFRSKEKTLHCIK